MRLRAAPGVIYVGVRKPTSREVSFYEIFGTALFCDNKTKKFTGLEVIFNDALARILVVAFGMIDYWRRGTIRGRGWDFPKHREQREKIFEDLKRAGWKVKEL